MNDLGVMGKPRKIFFSHRGVDVDMANGEIFINGRWYHSSQIQYWTRVGMGIDIYLDDLNNPIFKWRTFRQAAQDKMCQSMRAIGR